MNPTFLLLLQLLVILGAARVCGLLLRRLGQPPVIGEMAAGLLLGPIVFGAWWPDAHATLFAKPSLGALSGLSTMGVVLFMFIVGAELRAPEGTRTQVRTAFSVGLLGIALPMALGLGLAPWLHPRFAPQGVTFWPFALFIAATMSVTAFPVLARILKDRGMTRTPAGRLALSAAVIDDAAVWVILAVVLTLAGGAHASVATTAMGALLVVAVVFVGLRPLYARVLRKRGGDGEFSPHAFIWVLLGLLACAAVAEWIGLHAIFGAFLFGTCLPRDDRLLQHLAQKIEPVAVTLLMPILFALAGQATSADVFQGTGIGAFGLILLVAILGKVLGCTAGARLNGQDWRDSLAVGALMNARGLMELVVIKIGLDAGIIGPELFTLLFGMTLVTTFMASPMLSLCYRRKDGALAGADARR